MEIDTVLLINRNKKYNYKSDIFQFPIFQKHIRCFMYIGI